MGTGNGLAPAIGPVAAEGAVAGGVARGPARHRERDRNRAAEGETMSQRPQGTPDGSRAEPRKKSSRVATSGAVVPNMMSSSGLNNAAKSAGVQIRRLLHAWLFLSRATRCQDQRTKVARWPAGRSEHELGMRTERQAGERSRSRPSSSPARMLYAPCTPRFSSGSKVKSSETPPS